MNYSTGEWITPEQVGAMSSAVDELRRMLDKVVISAMDSSAGNWVIGSDNLNGAALSYANTTRTAIDSLDAARARVDAGQKSFASWSQWAEELHASLVDQLHEQGNWGLTAFLRANIAADAHDVGAAAADAADSAAGALKFGLPMAAVIVIGLVLLRVL